MAALPRRRRRDELRRNVITALITACFFGHLEVVKLLAANADKNQAAKNGKTALYIACEKGHAEVVTILIDAGATRTRPPRTAPRRCTSPREGRRDRHDAARRERRREPGRLPWHHAAAHRLPEGLRRGRTGRRGERHGGPGRQPWRTPLWTACRNGHIEVVATLLAANADVNQADNDGVTPLFIASANGHTETPRLLAAKANVNQPATMALRRCDRLLPRPPRRPAPLLRRQPHLRHARAVRHGGAHGRRPRPPRPPRLAHPQPLWSTTLHHLEVITPERALAMLRGGADILSIARPAGRRRSRSRRTWRRRRGPSSSARSSTADEILAPASTTRPRPRAAETMEPPDASVPGGAGAPAS